jgi:hypothetical protein
MRAILVHRPRLLRSTAVTESQWKILLGWVEDTAQLVAMLPSILQRLNEASRWSRMATY